MAKSKGKDAWFTPGGKREVGEDDIQALTREIKEELCVDLKPETIQYFEVYEAQAHGHPEGTIVRITCYTGDFDGELKASAEIEEVGWFSYDDPRTLTVTGKIIIKDLKQKGLLE